MKQNIIVKYVIINVYIKPIGNNIWNVKNIKIMENEKREVIRYKNQNVNIVIILQHAQQI